jgi:glutaminyl-peptide cyclotransferase
VAPRRQQRASPAYIVPLLFALVLGSRVGAAPVVAGFDGQRAFAALQRQCGFGPRCPGCPGHDAALKDLIATLRQHADEVSTQEFTHTHTATGDVLHLTNVIALFRSDAAPARETVLFAAHWDTRPTADQERDPDRRAKPIAGANDGASGVAVLLEVARVLADRRLDQNVILVLFDGEDYGPGTADMFLGSRYFAKHLPNPKPDWGAVVDMVGDHDLHLPIETTSWRRARPIVERVWGAAERLGVKPFERRLGGAVLDDHLPLLDAGVPCIDIIDMDYPAWHTLGDTPDQCRAASLQAVGDVLLAALEAH